MGGFVMAIALVAASGTMGTAQAATLPVRPFEGFPAAGVVPLTHGHSHNDYQRRHPLSDALSRGFTSVEVDVVLVSGQLLVGHDLVQALVRGATLRSLYLDPLADWVARNGGAVFPRGGPPLTLLVDVKSEARSTWRALEAVLAGYADMFTRVTSDGVHPGAVTVVVSGNRAPGLVAEHSDRFTALDGRADDLARAHPAEAALMPMVSERWGDLFRWSGSGEMPAAERAAMRALVETAHAQGRRVRFYDTPDRTAAARENVWRAELAAGVDLLNVDDLASGQAFLLEQQRGQERAPARTGVPPIRERAPRAR
ncbi:MAG TPA: phosphatidylinositol-specific phospholipase C/glycerophosphodiester phosphodiesterase family protein [Sporichthya sp.]|nr:phosphatidylinositol-specific phospholipase C/glycerophosphodiester phosphodiesterase family protein [Sporichthya sp.]